MDRTEKLAFCKTSLKKMAARYEGLPFGSHRGSDDPVVQLQFEDSEAADSSLRGDHHIPGRSMRDINDRINNLDSSPIIGQMKRNYTKSEDTNRASQTERDLSKKTQELNHKYIELEVMNNKYEMMIARMKSKDIRISHLEKQIKDLNMRHSRTRKDLQDNITKIRDELDSTRIRLKEKEREVTELENKLPSQAELENLKKQLSDAQDRIRTLEVDKKMLKESVAHLKTQVSIKQDTVNMDQLKTMLAKKDKETNAKGPDLEDMRSLMETNFTKFMEVIQTGQKAECSELQAKLKEAEEKLKEALYEQAAAKEREALLAHRLEEAKVAAREQVARLTDQLEELRSECRELTAANQNREEALCRKIEEMEKARSEGELALKAAEVALSHEKDRHSEYEQLVKTLQGQRQRNDEVGNKLAAICERMTNRLEQLPEMNKSVGGALAEVRDALAAIPATISDNVDQAFSINAEKPIFPVTPVKQLFDDENEKLHEHLIENTKMLQDACTVVSSAKDIAQEFSEEMNKQVGRFRDFNDDRLPDMLKNMTNQMEGLSSNIQGGLGQTLAEVKDVFSNGTQVLCEAVSQEVKKEIRDSIPGGGYKVVSFDDAWKHHRPCVVIAIGISVLVFFWIAMFLTRPSRRVTILPS